MKDFFFSQIQTIDAPLDEVFSFFSNPKNLGYLTPPWLDFRIITPEPVTMAEGTLIDYRIKLRGLPLRWRSRIATWEPPTRFVDEQVRGPYRSWIHEHRFIATEPDRTIVTDRIRYVVPGGLLVQRLFVRRDVERIFRFRSRRLDEIFRSEEISGRPG